MVFDPSKCDRDDCNIKRNGRTLAGTQRFYCKTCKKSWTPEGSPGGQALGERPMTVTERVRKHRAKHKK